MRILGLDVGTKTIGVAITDKSNTLAVPKTVIRYQNLADAINQISAIVNEENITDIVIGLPKNMDNSLGFASQRSLDFKDELAKQVPLNYHFVDERLTTKYAENILINNNYRREKRKKVIDSVAAVLILESFLNMKGENNGRN